MPDIINSSFDPRLPFPLDVRQQVQDMNALYAIPNTSRWEGMLVYVRSSETLYILKGGVDNSFWLALQFNGGGGLLPNGIVIYGEAQQSGNDILLNDAWVWRIDQVDYQSSDDVISITPAAAGNLRVDIIVGDNLGNFVKVVGTEVASPGPAIEPNIPADTVPLLRVDVNDTGITAITEFVLSAFVRYDINDQGLTPTFRQNARTNIQAVSKDTDDTRTGGLTNNGKVTIDLDEASSSLPILELYQQGVLKHLFSGEQARIIPHLLRVNEPIAPTARGAAFRGSVSGGDVIFEIQNSAGTKIFYPRGTGGIGQLRSTLSDESIRRDENYLTYPVSISGTGKLNDVALANGVGAIKFSSGVTEVSGIDPSGDGKELFIWSDNPDGMTLPAQDTDSIAANRYLREVNVPYQTWVKTVYDTDLSRWVNANTGELQETDARYFEVTDDVLTLKYILPDIAALQAFVRGPAVIAYVSDPLRGGYFNYVTEGDFVGSPDNGISFLAQDGGYWVREYKGNIQASWFGFLGNDLFNNSTLLTNLFTFLGRIDSNRTIEFGKGTFVFDTKIDFDYSNVTLVGQGTSNTVFKYTYQQVIRDSGYTAERVNSFLALPVGSEISNTWIKNLSIVYTGDYDIEDPGDYYGHGFGAISGIFAPKVNGFNLENVEISGFNDCGVRFDHTSMPVSYGDSQNVKIDNCKIHDNHFANVFGRNVDGFTATRGEFYNAGANLDADRVGTTGYGIAFAAINGNYSKNIVITNNNKFYDNNRKGVDSHGCGDITVTSNTFSGNRATQCGIFYNSGTIRVAFNVFENHLILPEFAGKPALRFTSLDVGRPNSISETGLVEYKFHVIGNVWKDIDITSGNSFLLFGVLSDSTKMNVIFNSNIIEAENLNVIINISSQLDQVDKQNKLSMIGNQITVLDSCYIAPFNFEGIEEYIIIGNQIKTGKQGVYPDGTTVSPRNPFSFLDINITDLVKEITYTSNSLTGQKWDGNPFVDPIDAVFVDIDAFATLSGVNRDTKVIAEVNWLNGIKDPMSDFIDYFNDNKTSGSGIPLYDGTDITFLTGGSTSYIRGDGVVSAFNPAVRGVQLVGFVANNAVITDSDSILVGLNKSQGQIDNLKLYVFRSDSVDANTNSNFSASDIDKYKRFTGSAGNANIVLNRFAATNELIGEVEGGEKTITGDGGVTIRTPTGFDPIVVTNGRYRIKFKTANDCLLTGDLVPSIS